jgi:hypothetical protein
MGLESMRRSTDDAAVFAYLNIMSVYAGRIAARAL